MNIDLESFRRPAFDVLPVLLDAAAKGLALLGVAGILVLAMRKASAAARQVVWLLALAALIVLPVASATLPSWGILPGWVKIEIAEPAEPAAADSTDSTADTALTPADPLRGADQSDMRPIAPPSSDYMSVGAPSGQAIALEPALHADGDTATSAAATAKSATPARIWRSWVAPSAVAAWLAGALVCLLPLILGRISLWRLARRSRRIDGGSWNARLNRAAQAVGLRRPITLLQSSDEIMPMVWGTLQPKLLLPADAEGWTVERRWVVLLHELAHAKRRDCLAKLIAHVACAFYWFNPLCWIAFKLMQREAEAACDDLVLNSTAAPAANSIPAANGATIHPVRPSDYAQHLLEIASGLKSGMLAGYSSIAMARKSKLEGRLLAILDAKRNRRALTRNGILVAAALVVAVAIPLACMSAPQPPRFTNATIELRMDLESGTYVPRSQPVAVLKVTDKKRLEELLAFFPDMDRGKEAWRAAGWESNAEIRFTRLGGGQMRIMIGPDDDDGLAVWSEGKGDRPVRGDLKAFLLALQRQQTTSQSATQPATQPAAFEKFSVILTSPEAHSPKSITIGPGGSYRLEMPVLENVPGKDYYQPAEEPYVATYRLSDAHLEELKSLLSATGWLSKAVRVDENLKDAERYAMSVSRDENTAEVICYGKQDQPYTDLIRFLNRIVHQEWVLWQLQGGDEADDETAVGLWLHLVEGELRGLLGEPSHAKPHTPALDYNRLLPVLQRIAKEETPSRRNQARAAIEMIHRLTPNQPATQPAGFIVQGAVTDSDGKAMPGVTVRASAGLGTLMPTGSTTTDEEGRYVLKFGPGFRPSAGDEVGFQAAVIVAEKAACFETNLSRQGDLRMASKLPSKEALKDWPAEKVVLPGKPVTVNFIMAPAASVQVRLVDQRGTPLADRQLYLNAEKTWPAASLLFGGRTDKDGRIQWSGIPTSLKCWFEAPRPSGRDSDKSGTVEFEHGQYDVKLRLIGSGSSQALELVECVRAAAVASSPATEPTSRPLDTGQNTTARLRSGGPSGG